MKKLFFSFLILSLISCGGGSSGGDGDSAPSTPISVSVSPVSATVPAATTHQFTATVQNTTNTAVTWQVNTISGGD